MRTSKLYFFIWSMGLIGCLGLVSCENEDTFIPDNESSTFSYSRDISKVSLQDLKPDAYRFEIFSDWGGGYFFPDGSGIEFQGNSFLLNGSLVTGKIIQIEVELVRNKTQMVSHLAGTSSGDKIIESGGMANVRAFCDGKELTIDPARGYVLRLSVPGGNFNPGMELFYGEETNNGINWIEADGDPQTQNNVFFAEWTPDSTGRDVLGMECFPKKLGWVNCDYFSKLNDKPLGIPCLIAHGPSNGDVVNLEAFAVFKNYMVVIQPCCKGSKEEVCFGPLPVGEPVYYIMIGKGNKGYYLGYLEKDIIADDKVVIELEIKTLQEIKDFLNTL
ncbi:MAG: hypothetical protein IPM34_01320 [Saprospiraceae bacterium]|nr:hypothetical protein [Saprospiraceae bacterium]